jgi:alpha-1,3-rhamnosyl/mannosyltransferase
MKLLVNLRPLKLPLTGIGFYTKNILDELVKRDVQLVGILNGKILTISEIISLLESLDNRLPSIDNSKFISLVRNIPGMYRLREIIINLRSKKNLSNLSNEGYIYFEPSFIPLEYEGKKVVTIHDLSFLSYPEFHPKQRVNFMKDQVANIIPIADSIITDSNFIKSELLKYYVVDESKVNSLLLGVKGDFTNCCEDSFSLISDSFGLKYKNYILSVATLEPRKNLLRLIEAFKLLPKPLRQQFPLVLVGGIGWDNEDFFHSISSLLEEKELIITGYVKDEQLKLIYAGATLFAYPSLYEGFGLPVIEAMSSGLAVITSNRGATQEISNGCAQLIDPESVEDISNGIKLLLHNGNLRTGFEQKSRENAKQYTWNKTVNELLTIIRSI